MNQHNFYFSSNSLVPNHLNWFRVTIVTDLLISVIHLKPVLRRDLSGKLPFIPFMSFPVNLNVRLSQMSELFSLLIEFTWCKLSFDFCPLTRNINSVKFIFAKKWCFERKQVTWAINRLAKKQNKTGNRTDRFFG